MAKGIGTQQQSLSQIEQSLSPYFKMVWDDIANAPVDATDLAAWNTFFGTDDITNGFGMPFQTLTVVGNTVTLYGGIGLNIQDSLFSDNSDLLEVYSNIIGLNVGASSFLLCISLGACVFPTAINLSSQALKSCTSLTQIDLSSCVTLGANVFQNIIGQTFTLRIPLVLSTDAQVITLLAANPLSTVIYT